jgi:malate dehydrogenase (oxaloacetate-decarboxylating)(NADP+)
MIYASATSLSTSLNKAEVADMWLYPDIARIRDVSVVVAMGVIRAAQKAGVDREVRIRGMGDEGLEKWVRERMYDPHTETAMVEEEVAGVVQGATNGVSSPNGHTNGVNGKASHL